MLFNAEDKILDPREGQMYYDDIVSGRNNVGMNKCAINLTFYGFVFVKRM